MSRAIFLYLEAKSQSQSLTPNYTLEGEEKLDPHLNLWQTVGPIRKGHISLRVRICRTLFLLWTVISE